MQSVISTEEFLSSLEKYLNSLMNKTHQISILVKSIKEEGVFLKNREYKARIEDVMKTIRGYQDSMKLDVKQINALIFLINKNVGIKNDLKIYSRINSVKDEMSSFLNITNEYIRSITDLYSRINFKESLTL